jgi:hypothetical protein
MLLVLMFGALGATEAQWSNPSGIIYTTNTSDKVGIGTTSPTSKLSIGDTASVVNAAGSKISVYDNGTTFYGIGLTNYSSKYGIGLFTNGNFTANPRLLVNEDGNVGIGTTSPYYKLSLGGSSDTLGFYSDATHFNSIEFYNSSTGGMVFDQNTAAGGGYTWNFAHSPLVTFLSGGNVGIGTTTPGAKLDVAGFVKINTLNSHLMLAGATSNGMLQVSGNTLQVGNWDVTSRSLNIDLATGNVGIGRSDPGYKLDVNGTINSNSTITANNIVAKYQDVAEWVPSSEQLSAGTVVVLDSTKANQVTSSSVSYDTRVAGVISEQPGIALGEKSEGKVLVATTGRVCVKVDASKSPLHIGDLLVTSDVPGVAMKSEPVEFAGRKMHMPGTLIGKALESINSGTGTILVLLSLQ